MMHAHNARLLAAAVAALVAAGCSDAGVMDVNHPQFTPRQYVSGPTTSDPATTWPVVIRSAYAEASFPSVSVTYPAEAAVTGQMVYDAYHASIGATIWLRGLSSEDRTYSPRERHTNNFQANSFTSRFPVLVSHACGHTLEGSVQFRAWMQTLTPAGMRILDEDTNQRNAAGSQSACPEEEEDTPVEKPAGDTDCVTCADQPAYTWCRIWYMYDIQTGEILESRVLFCW